MAAAATRPASTHNIKTAKHDLERLSDSIGLPIRIAHYPPYCSRILFLNRAQSNRTTILSALWSSLSRHAVRYHRNSCPPDASRDDLNRLENNSERHQALLRNRPHRHRRNETTITNPVRQIPPQMERHRPPQQQTVIIRTMLSDVSGSVSH